MENPVVELMLLSHALNQEVVGGTFFPFFGEPYKLRRIIVYIAQCSLMMYVVVVSMSISTAKEQKGAFHKKEALFYINSY